MGEGGSHLGGQEEPRRQLGGCQLGGPAGTEKKWLKKMEHFPICGGTIGYLTLWGHCPKSGEKNVGKRIRKGEEKERYIWWKRGEEKMRKNTRRGRRGGEEEVGKRRRGRRGKEEEMAKRRWRRGEDARKGNGCRRRGEGKMLKKIGRE